MGKESFLSVESLIKEYDGARVINEISFQINEGESIGLVGESGCGKSTMARLIAGLEKPNGGRILLWGEPYRLRREKNKKCHINMVFQDPIDSFNSHMTVFDSLYEALGHTRKINRKDALPIIEEALETVELPKEYIKRKASQISGGECQRIGIARAILTEPELLICDEATSALDVSVQAQIIHLLRRLKKEKKFTYLFISHDLGLVACMCSRVLVMYKGTLVEEGNVEQIMKSPRHPYTRLLLSCGEAFVLDKTGETGLLPKVPEEGEKAYGGCAFYPRCAWHTDKCRELKPMLSYCEEGHKVACYFEMTR